MKISALIGNPPYQSDDNGNGKSAKPVYQHFIEAAKELNPDCMEMIVPSRWMAGGKGLDNFRKEMLNDTHIKKIVDYENYKDVFPDLGGLAGGVCYFYRDKNYNGNCEMVNKTSNTEFSAFRQLNEHDILIRSNKAAPIVKKILETHKGQYMSEFVSSRKPFNLPTNYKPQESGIPCQFIQKIGLKYAKPEDVQDPNNILNKWKFIAPKAPIAGQTDFSKPVGIYYESNTKILPPGTCCTESFIVLYACDSEDEIKSFKSYLFTKVARFLLLQCVVSQDITKDRFRFVPKLDCFEGIYTDEMLCKKWNITDEEWQYIDSKVQSSTTSGGDSDDQD